MPSRRVTRRVLLAGLLFGSFAGCSGGAPRADSPRSPEPSAPRPPAPGPSDPGQRPDAATPSDPAPEPQGGAAELVTLHMSGGYAGLDDEIVVRTDGSYTTSGRRGPGRPGSFDGAEVARLRRLLDEAALTRLPARSVDPNLRDNVLYRVTYRDHVVVTDLSEPVPALSDAITLLRTALTEALRR
ncbi:hypothetical protein [Streptomyces sp. Z26]|uniref:hypothetical protein n=1 Tax=Streptomyces sp. Z26 TaxID=2500177 RepID=UPI000EF1633A|nr:hypothetical protein [Streptomyces sp. Z26]RLL68858.1 hypothetical protein D7M15_20765 [Streptomyces sp. Z26]